MDFSSETMAAATFDAASQTGASSMTNPGARMARRHFSDEPRFCLQHQDGRIRVRWHRGKRILATCIRHRHTGPTPGMMVRRRCWIDVSVTSCSH
ncbi:hypothetical protein TNCV_2676291 [Trichonephila clavipes]|nr:hypothetical protein TNCV_2676291 [Trichonephila clavipes]